MQDTDPHAGARPARKTFPAYAFIAILAGALLVAFLVVSGRIGPGRLKPADIIDLMQGPEPHEGFRRAHAKGFCVSGQFRSTGALQPYSSAAIFKPGATAFIGRYSTGGNNPTAPDLQSPVRSLALAFSLAGGQQWRTAMNTPPVLPVRTPEAFHAQLAAMQPDPATGKPNMARIMAFMKSHPESANFLAWQAGYKPTGSLATERYHSINIFHLVDDSGRERAVRWAAAPQAPASPPLQDPHPDALQREFATRLDSGPVVYDLVFTFAGPGDPVDDVTALWPADRQTVVAGTIEIGGWEPQAGGACGGLNFDPVVLPDGIRPGHDPILHARGAAYAESQRRRAREQLAGAE